ALRVLPSDYRDPDPHVLWPSFTSCAAFAALHFLCSPIRNSNSPRFEFRVLKLQSPLTSRIGECLDAAMIPVVSAVERRLGDALGQRLFRELLSDDLRPLHVAALGDRGGHVLRATGGGSERGARQIVDELSVNMFGAAEHRQTRTFRAAHDFPAHMAAAAQLAAMFGFLLVHIRCPLSRNRLTSPRWRTTCLLCGESFRLRT